MWTRCRNKNEEETDSPKVYRGRESRQNCATVELAIEWLLLRQRNIANVCHDRSTAENPTEIMLQQKRDNKTGKYYAVTGGSLGW
jgi:hypothetical protein